MPCEEEKQKQSSGEAKWQFLAWMGDALLRTNNNMLGPHAAAGSSRT